MDKLTIQFSRRFRGYQNNFNSLLHYILIRVIRDTNNLISLFAQLSIFLTYMIFNIKVNLYLTHNSSAWVFFL